MSVISIGVSHLRKDFTDKTKRGESLHYLLAMVCVAALVLINIFGQESKDINGILGAAIAGLVYGGIQRGKYDRENETPPTPRKRRVSDKQVE